MAIGTVPDAVILYLQVAAASFMAADYFFNEQERKPINSAIQKKTREIRERIAEDGRKLAEDIFSENFGRTLAALIFISLTFAGLTLMRWLAPMVSGLVVASASLIFLFFFSAALLRLLDVAVKLAPLAFFGLPLWLIAWCVDYCKKGSIFGIGFVFLIASFGCRFLNLP